MHTKIEGLWLHITADTFWTWINKLQTLEFPDCEISVSLEHELVPVEW